MKKIALKIERGPHLAVGLMSGNSHDGVSAALVRIQERRRTPVELLSFKTYPYDTRFRARLLAAGGPGRPGVAEISQLNFGLGRAFAGAALNLVRSAGVPIEELSFIGSHGHTFFHLPPRAANRGAIPSTLQLGEPAVIAALTGVPVVADFRPMDVALGGEGAPLAPLIHLRLFGDRSLGRVVQNIGGIANCTYLPPGAQPDTPGLIAFDTGPGNMVIDGVMARLSRGRERMDLDGRVAAQGAVSSRLLAEMLRHPYFARRCPKSTGREEFGDAFIDRLWSRSRALKLAPRDIAATATALTARTIADAVRRFVMPLGPLAELIVAGGGARNPTLMAMLARELPDLRVLRAAEAGVNGDALEAIAFAVLAYEMLNGRPGNIPSVTGARTPAVLGKLTMPP
ncbi:MAG TPA: anhydro-N-acetylmuramic acid kinase [Candidatus Binataceae bacterium]|nr:anhydro-N-acetylmuramic acid kinase [Candidatus Binataceae bacterium]